MKPITILGGGLAGLSLGIQLRERQVPVTIHEAGHYPRHRVCGEFISGGGQRALKHLNIPTASARTAAFFSRSEKSWHFELPEPALCVSRYVLDKALADAFSDAGGKLVCGARSQAQGEGIVRATGRRLHPVENGWRWFGLKAHVTGIELEADLEMHLAPNGYVGICRLPEGRFNVCGLFRKRKGEADRATLADSVGGRLRGAKWIEDSFAAVAGLCFCAPAKEGECHVGDAHAMIAPLTGNGMSMAFESAEAATDPLSRYAHGEVGWSEAVRQVGEALRDFRARLAWGKWLQWAAFHSWLLPFCSRAALRKMLFAATR